MKIKLFFILFCCLVASSVCENLILGHIYRPHLLNQTTVKYNAMPFEKQVKNFFYSDPELIIIKGIMAHDNLNSKASALVTAGGIDYYFVNMVLTSEQGKGLDYDITIYY